MSITTARRAATSLIVFTVLALAAPAGAAEHPPLKASDAGEFWFPDEHGCGSAIEVVIAGSGHGTQLGSYTFEATECFDPATGAVDDGAFTITAADGSTLVGTYSGHVEPTEDPEVIAYIETAIVTGGTGRFDGSTATLQVRGLADVGDFTYTQSFTGELPTGRRR